MTMVALLLRFGNEVRRERQLAISRRVDPRGPKKLLILYCPPPYTHTHFRTMECIVPNDEKRWQMNQWEAFHICTWCTAWGQKKHPDPHSWRFRPHLPIWHFSAAGHPFYTFSDRELLK